MKMLFLNWRDLKNPRSGGAEVVTEEVLERLVANGHEVTLFTTLFPGASSEENIDGYRVIRRGGEKTVHLWACILWFKKFRAEKFDVVIDQIHGIPFFTPLYIRGPKVVAFIHEVAREIWLRMYPFPVGRIGYTIEPFFYRFYRNTSFITVSHSTKRDLESVGIPESHIAIIPEAVTVTPLARDANKDPIPTIIFVGRIARMKGVHHLLEAYTIAKKSIPTLRIWLLGGGDKYKAELIEQYKHDFSVTFHGFVSVEKKLELLERSTVLASASMKEGYGLVVIEAAAMQTPSVVYNVDGFNEAVEDGKTGVLTDTTPQALADGLVSLFKDKERYVRLQRQAWERSKEFTFDRTTQVFEEIIMKV
jgi:glycosyltransferase involved in cell wall biosynthesis